MSRTVAVVADPASGGLGQSLGRAFADVGWQVRLVPWGSWKPALLASAAHRNARLARLMARRLVVTATPLLDREVSLVLVVKGAFLDATTIQQLRAVTSGPVVCWNPDSPFDTALSNRGAGLPEAVAAYDGYVTWADDVAEQLSTWSSRVTTIPFGCDPHLHFEEAGDSEAADRVVLIGTWTPERESLVRKLATFEPLIFGSSWPKVRGIQVREAIEGAAFRRVVGAARWNLNPLRPQNSRSHNMRSFEVPACGGRQVTFRTSDHERLLAGSSVTLVDGPDDLAEVLARDALPPIAIDDLWRERNGYTARVLRLIEWVDGW